MAFGRAGSAADAVAAGAAAQQQHYVARFRGFPDHIFCRSCGHHRAHFQALGDVAGVVKFLHHAGGQANLVAIGGVAVGCAGNDAALGKLAGQRFADRHRGIARAGDAHGLVDVGTAGQGIADGAADAGGRAAERLDLGGVVVGFVFKHQQPVLLLAVNGGADAHGAGVDFLALVKHGQLAALFQHFGAQRGQVH